MIVSFNYNTLFSQLFNNETKFLIMRKLFILTTFIMFAYAANAQFGIQAGATFYSEKVKFEGGSLNTDTKVGFTAGIVYSAPLSANISFMPSLNFTQKGGKSSS